jgi:16S rRNA (cytosine967-C5)-methyltransferase
LAKPSISPARWTAFEVLRKVDVGSFSSTLLASEEPKLEPADRALCHELVLGVLRWQLNLDKRIEYFSDRKIESLDVSVLIALRLGLYQLRFLTRVPASAAVNESVKLVQAARLSSARAFVNAVLRRAARESDYDPVATGADVVSKIAIEASHPSWLINRWINSFGLEEARALARADNEAPPVVFRVVQTRADEDELLARFRASGMVAEKSRIADGAWRVARSTAVLRALAEEGMVYFQDEASQLVAELVGAKPGDTVLDLCAAPGGKTTLIADRRPDSHVVASDVSARRLKTVEAAAGNQQLKNISLMVIDGAQSLPFKPGSFDRILVDAPCSGTGTLRHNPEIRWRLSEDDIPRLAIQQGLLLRNAVGALKQGGRLIYSTCSIEREENEDLVEEFLKRNKTMRRLLLKPPSGLTAEAGALRTWPQKNGCDGFFVAAFEKIE